MKMIFGSIWLIYLVVAQLSYGATINAASPSLDDVASAVSQSRDGDRVLIPAGNATWSATLTINKSITLSGAGLSSTLITRGSKFKGDLIYISGLSADVPITVSGISFDNAVYGVGDTPCVRVVNPFKATWGYTKIRIDHCKFNKGQRQVWWSGWAYGLVDHCQFQNANIMVFLQGDDNYAWLRPTLPGTANSVYVEDSTFSLDNSVNDPGSWIYHQEGGRSVIRHNTFDSHSYTLSNDVQFYDCHGNQNYYTNGFNDFRGTPNAEIYENTFHVRSTYRMLYFRAGSMIVYNNKFTVDTGSVPDILNMSEEEGWQTSFFSPLRKTWPAEDQINNCFYWGNTLNGKAQTSGDFGTWNANDGVFIKAGRDYWLKPPDSTTVTTYPNPASPPSSSSYPNPYTPVTSYTALAYPHPLQGGTPAPTPTPPQPTPTPSATPPQPTPSPTISPSPSPQPSPTPPPEAEATYQNWLNELSHWIETHPATPDQ